MKILRPRILRAKNGPGGRVEHDARGNAVWTKTRADDSQELPDTSLLSIADDKPLPGRPTPTVKKKPR